MRTSVLVVSALALAATFTSANALTLVNKDKARYTVMVTPTGGKPEKVVLKSKGTAEYDCSKGCQLSVGPHKASYDAKVTKIAIQHGKFMTL